ncbi:isoleucine--tRNA ligase [Actinomadura nitritigenes]|uniref:isoleucine--tRNA ligase n=1 Tax=Actinomadura nitritigenes TaxID=134602 RepID=UPI003D8C50B2
MPFEAVEQRPEPAALEERVLERWRARRVYQRTVERTADGPPFTFYGRPPAAGGRPGVHHVQASVFKDIFPRHRTMKGAHVPRAAGWDCHGLGIEVEVEEQLGIDGKSRIEEYGVAEFNAHCRDSVIRSIAELDRLAQRMGARGDGERTYSTMSAEYVESVWWSLKTLFEKGLIYREERVAPYCPRCGTALSDHEVARGYAPTDDPSVYVRFPLLDGPLADEGADLLIWTTMPWTLVPATLAVVGKQIRYVLAAGGRAGDRPVVMAADRVETVLGDGARVIRDVHVGEIAGFRYRAPFDFVGPGSADDPHGDPASWRFVVTADFVKANEGTGVVHTGAAFGEDDMRVAREHGVPVVRPVRPDGRFDGRAGPYAGMYVRDADAPIVADLRDAGLLLHAGVHRHTYPFCCWCATPLLYYATPSWYIATTRVRDRMLAGNAEIDWRPPHVRDGRYGEWLAGNVDWALSRERYWGTPLPFWSCDACGHVIAIGSLAELAELSKDDLTGLDPHRPHVDEVTIPCDRCPGGVLRRVPEVVDAWYDSGAMPFAQFGHPHTAGGEDRSTADLVCESIDETRGWFYALQAVGTLLFGRSGFRRALCLGNVVDTDGRRMSTAAANVPGPWELIDEHGADALRWLLATEGDAWQPRPVSTGRLRDVTRKTILTLWNTYYFFVTYANHAGWTPRPDVTPIARRPVLDRWILARLAEATERTDAALTDFDAARAGRELAAFVDDLSNWYVRCSRSRFWNEDREDAGAAFATLHSCLTTLARLIAPMMPFLADELHENLVRSVTASAPDSVHLTDYPVPDESARDAALCEAMAVARRLVTLGRDARGAAGVPVRRPLRRAQVTVPADARTLLPAVSQVIASELNVRSVELGISAGVTRTLKPDFRALGRDFGSRTKAIAAAIAGVDADKAVAELDAQGHFTVEPDGAAVALRAGHVQIVERPAHGWQISADGPYGVALDLDIDRDLHLEGLARELVRLINDLRKREGFDLADRIAVDIAPMDDADGEIGAMLSTHAEAIARDVQARAVTLDGGTASTSATRHRFTLGHGTVLVTLNGSRSAGDPGLPDAGLEADGQGSKR